MPYILAGNNYVTKDVYLTMMRLLGYILSIYVTLLAIYPCADGPKVSVQTAISARPLNFAPDGCSGDETCSPFCVCSCCAGFSLLDNAVSLPKNDFRPNTCYIILPEISTSRYEVQIWQPPKA